MRGGRELAGQAMDGGLTSEGRDGSGKLGEVGVISEGREGFGGQAMEGGLALYR